MMLEDNFGRTHNYLRIGVTDRCNLRCRYCMPEEGIDFSQRKDLLSYEEIIRLSYIFGELGVTKVRLTGGEPFSRKNILFLIRSLHRIFDELYITTNATLLEEHIQPLSDLGIGGLNISLDTLDRNRFEMITRRDSFLKVMHNIDQCLTHRIPIKLNMVVMKGINDHEIFDFISFGKKKNIPVRFIEAMPFNATDGNKNQFLSEQAILEKLMKKYDSIIKIHPNNASSSNTYSIDNQYAFGIIPAFTRSLCSSCNRIRMTPKGELLTCLYSNEGLSLREVVRDSSYCNQRIKEMIMNKMKTKKETGKIAQDSSAVLRSMTTIGG